MMIKNSYAKQILLMLIPCVLLILSNDIAWVVFLFATIEILILRYIFPVLIILNIVCFWTVKNDIQSAAVNLSLCGGFVGGFIAANTVNKNFADRREINSTFIAQLFVFVIYPLLTYALFEFDIHGMLM